MKNQPVLPLTSTELAPAYQRAPPVTVISLILIKSSDIIPLALDIVAAFPAESEVRIAIFPSEAVVVISLTVCVVPSSISVHSASPPLFRARTLNVFEPVITTSSPVMVRLL